MLHIFDYDGPVIQLMNKVADCILLSLLWLVTCIPVVTIGASTTALYYAVNKCIRHSEGGVWKEFRHSFRNNFRQATALWGILIALYSALLACCYCAYLMCMEGYLPVEMLYFLLIVVAVVTLWANYLFPYLAKFHNSVKQICKNCCYIALMNFPKTLILLVVDVVAILAVLIFPLAIAAIPAAGMVVSCYTLEPVFLKYMSEEARAKEELRHSETSD